MPDPVERAIRHAAEDPVRAVQSALEDALYVGVGLGILTFQKAQVRRRELEKALGSTVDRAGGAVGDHLKLVEERFRAATER